ncbi:TrmH family RNA methyltransferase, partial [Klebsiella pneumoniae]|uniref:TrmH family RNA methyltransferase n=1 Tax=Klebsiella pneumoniae TaxID=573 RepID=UPI002731DFF4
AAANRVIAESAGNEIAIVFGREKSGLTNEETRLCHYLINIPTSKEYHSLNLAQAVQVVTHEIHMASLSELPGEVDPPD